jgi:hypothetical protein
MQNRRGIEMLWWNERKQLTVASCIEKLVDETCVAKTKMIPTGEEFR